MSTATKLSSGNIVERLMSDPLRLKKENNLALYAPNYKCLNGNDRSILQQSKVPIPDNEAERIFALRQTDLLDSDRNDPMFDRFTSLAQRLFDVPIALVSLVDIKRQWFKSAIGLEVSETHRDAAFCAYTVLPDSPDVLVIEDALLDYRFKNNELVTGPPYIRFYAGAALIIDDVRMGSLCIIDTEPHIGFTTRERMNLLDLGVAVSNLIKERRDAVVNRSKQSAMMILDMLNSIKHPLHFINHTVTKLSNVSVPESQADSKVGGDPASALLLPTRPSNPKPSQSSGREAKINLAEDSLDTLATREMQLGLVKLNVIMASSMCLGQIMMEKADRRVRWSGFTITNVMTTIDHVQGILSQLESQNAHIKWNVDLSSMRESTRHLCPQQVLYYAILSGVELLLSDWEDVEISLNFKEVDDVEYDTLVRYLEEFPDDDADGDSGMWVQGLFRVVCRVSKQRPISTAISNSGESVTSRFESLELVLKDSDGGYANGIHPVATAAEDERVLECWTPFAIHLGQGRDVDDKATSIAEIQAGGKKNNKESTRVQGDGDSRGKTAHDAIVDPTPAVQAVAVAHVTTSAAGVVADTTATAISCATTKAAPSPAPADVPKQCTAAVSAIPRADKMTKILRLLHVDDSVPVQRLMGKWLRSEGCVVTSASNGKIAMDLMKTKTFDICFMDFLMPVMSGVDAIVQHYEWLLGDHDRTHNKDMLVVGLSESTTDDELKLVFNHGCHFFCTKPPETHILSSIISLKRQSADLEGAIAAIRDELDHSGIHGCYQYRLHDGGDVDGDERSDVVTDSPVKMKNVPKKEKGAGSTAPGRQSSDLTQSGNCEDNRNSKRESFNLKRFDSDSRRSTTTGGWKVFNALTNPFSKK